MADPHDPLDRTASLLVDRYDDVLSEGGKPYLFLELVANELGPLDNPRALDRTVRDTRVPVFIVPGPPRHRFFQQPASLHEQHPASIRKPVNGGVVNRQRPEIACDAAPCLKI